VASLSFHVLDQFARSDDAIVAVSRYGHKFLKTVTDGAS
jgi:hypothetical protein